MWVKHLEYEGENWIFMWAGGRRQFGYPYWGTSTSVKLCFNCETTEGWKAVVSNPQPADLGTWHQVGVIYSDETKYLGFILDGKIFHETTYPYTLAERSGVWQINTGVGGIKALRGFISLTLVYDRILSASEARHDYLNPMSPVTDGLVLWLKMEEGSGNIVHDYSGYGNDGTIYGASWTEITHDPVRTLSPLRILSPVR